MKRHVRAEATGIKTRPDARKWVAEHVNNYSSAPQWPHADLVGSIFTKSDLVGIRCMCGRSRPANFLSSGILSIVAARTPTVSKKKGPKSRNCGQWRRGTLVAFVAVGCVRMRLRRRGRSVRLRQASSDDEMIPAAQQGSLFIPAIRFCGLRV